MLFIIYCCVVFGSVSLDVRGHRLGIMPLEVIYLLKLSYILIFTLQFLAKFKTIDLVKIIMTIACIKKLDFQSVLSKFYYCFCTQTVRIFSEKIFVNKNHKVTENYKINLMIYCLLFEQFFQAKSPKFPFMYFCPERLYLFLFNVDLQSQFLKNTKFLQNLPSFDISIFYHGS